jgi:hypothetical protein
MNSPLKEPGMKPSFFSEFSFMMEGALQSHLDKWYAPKHVLQVYLDRMDAAVKNGDVCALPGIIQEMTTLCKV